MAEAGIFQDQLSCTVCLDLLKDPVTIPCGHSYCMDCITKSWNRRELFTEVYNCPRCRQTFTPRPALYKNVMFAELVDKLKKTRFVHAGPGDVECDVCTGRKYKAVKSCLDCLKSYCQTHLEQHDICLFHVSKHKLINPTRGLHAMICPKHKKPLEIYCRTDQQCICYPCTMEGHKNHEIVKVATEKTWKQMQLKEMQRTLQQKIHERKNESEELKKFARSYMHSSQTAVEDSDRIFTELIRSIEKCRSEVKQLIRKQEQAAVSQADSLSKQLDEEIIDLKRRYTELHQLSYIDDDISFLQGCKCLSAAIESQVSHNIFVNSLVSFDDVRKSVSQLKEKLENVCKEEIETISDRVTYITFIRPNNPNIWKEMLLYFSQFTLDSNTVNHCLSLSDGNRVATNTDTHQQYPDHLERFEYCAQVLCKESVSGRCYWEVEWSGSAGVYITMAYKTISRKNNTEECSFEHSNQSWGVYCRPSHYAPPSSIQQPSIFGLNPYYGLSSDRQTPWTLGQFLNNNKLSFDHVSSSCPRIGVYVDHSAGTLSFYSVSDTMTLIHRVQTTFAQPLYPGFAVYKGSTVKMLI